MGTPSPPGSSGHLRALRARRRDAARPAPVPQARAWPRCLPRTSGPARQHHGQGRAEGRPARPIRCSGGSGPDRSACGQHHARRHPPGSHRPRDAGRHPCSRSAGKATTARQGRRLRRIDARPCRAVRGLADLVRDVAVSSERIHPISGAPRGSLHDVWKTIDRPIAREALEQIGKLYDVEAAINAQPRDVRHAVRQPESRPNLAPDDRAASAAPHPGAHPGAGETALRAMRAVRDGRRRPPPPRDVRRRRARAPRHAPGRRGSRRA